eukprot:403367747
MCCDLKYKLIIMHLNLPIMNGFEAAERIQEIQQTRNQFFNSQSAQTLNIIAIPAFENQEDIDRCQQVGFQEVFQRPLDQEKLKCILDKFYYNNI